MSGHRMTSMINTILNAAYMRIILGPGLYNRCECEHVGDDILISTDSAVDAELVVELCYADPRQERGEATVLVSGLWLQPPHDTFQGRCQ